MQNFYSEKKQDMQDRLRRQDTQDKLINPSRVSCRKAILHILFLFTAKNVLLWDQV